MYSKVFLPFHGIHPCMPICVSNFKTGDRKSYMGGKKVFAKDVKILGLVPKQKTYYAIADLVNYKNKHWWTLMDCKFSKMKCKKS